MAIILVILQIEIESSNGYTQVFGIVSFNGPDADARRHHPTPEAQYVGRHRISHYALKAHVLHQIIGCYPISCILVLDDVGVRPRPVHRDKRLRKPMYNLWNYDFIRYRTRVASTSGLSVAFWCTWCQTMSGSLRLLMLEIENCYRLTKGSKFQFDVS